MKKLESLCHAKDEILEAREVENRQQSKVLQQKQEEVQTLQSHVEVWLSLYDVHGTYISTSVHVHVYFIVNGASG